MLDAVLLRYADQGLNHRRAAGFAPVAEVGGHTSGKTLQAPYPTKVAGARIYAKVHQAKLRVDSEGIRLLIDRDDTAVRARATPGALIHPGSPHYDDLGNELSAFVNGAKGDYPLADSQVLKTLYIPVDLDEAGSWTYQDLLLRPRHVLKGELAFPDSFDHANAAGRPCDGASSGISRQHQAARQHSDDQRENK